MLKQRRGKEKREESKGIDGENQREETEAKRGEETKKRDSEESERAQAESESEVEVEVRKEYRERKRCSFRFGSEIPEVCACLEPCKVFGPFFADSERKKKSLLSCLSSFEIGKF